MNDDERRVYELSDLDVEQIGLVFRGANRRPFFFVKSGGDDMEGQEDFSDILQELESVEEINDTAWQKLVGVVKSALTRPDPEPEPSNDPEPEEFADLTAADRKKVADLLRALGKDKLGERVYAMLTKLAGEGAGYGYPEKGSGEAGEQFAELLQTALAEQAEQFTEKIEAEREAREKVEAALAEEQRLRRLQEFTEVADGFSSLPRPETFAEDLMRIADTDVGLYERLHGMLAAANEAVQQGQLFAQFSVAGGEPSGDPFEAAVERIRTERFSEMGLDEGWVKAFGVAQAEHPDLARRYERSTRMQ